MNTLLMSLTIMIMTHEMPKLPYAHNALEPVISQQTIDYHYGKHLQPPHPTAPYSTMPDKC